MKDTHLLSIILAFVFACTNQNSSSHFQSSKTEVNCHVALEVVLRNHIDHLLSNDRLRYLSSLSTKDLQSFSPGLSVDEIRFLQQEIRQLKVTGLSPADQSEVITFLRREIEIDDHLLDRVRTQYSSWASDAKNELHLRNEFQLMGIGRGKKFTQALFREMVDEKLLSIDLRKAFTQSLSSSEMRHYFFTQGQAARSFRQLFQASDASSEDALKKMIQDAGLRTEGIDGIRSKVNRYIIHGHIQPELDQLVTDLFVSYLRARWDQIRAEDVVNQLVSNVEDMKSSWVSGPFRASELADEPISSLIPLSLHLHQTSVSAPLSGMRFAPLYYLRNLIAFDLYVNPTERFSRLLFDAERVSELFKLTAEPARLWDSGLLTTHPAIERMLSEPMISGISRADLTGDIFQPSILALIRRIAGWSLVAGVGGGSLSIGLVLTNE